jgi:hypothetical protein
MGLLKQSDNIQNYGCDKCMYEVIADLDTWGFIGYSPRELNKEEPEGV